MATKTVQTVKLQVTVLLLQEQGKWVAQCLEHDVAAQADTLSGVKQAFVKALASQACVNIHHGKKAMEDVPQAPDFYFELFRKGMKIEKPALPQTTRPGVDVQVKAMAFAA